MASVSSTPRPPLSETELEILRLVATGATNREIARERSISEATVKKHITNINTKLGTANRTEAMRRALELGLVTVGTPGPAPQRDTEAARRLATELERARRRSRRLALWIAAAVIIVIAAAFSLAYDYMGPHATPTPTAAPRPSSTQSPPWLVGVDLPRPLTGAACASFPDEDAVFVASGREATGVTTTTMRYRSGEFRWDNLADKPTAVEDARAVALQGRFLVPGGCQAGGQATRTVEVYDPDADRWTEAAELPEPVCAYALVVVEGNAYLFGGRSSADPESASDSVYRYRPDDDLWTLEARMPLPRSDLAAVADGNRIRLLGGRDRGGQLQSSHWIYRPFGSVDQRWDLDTAPPLPEARAGLGALGTPIGSVMVVGGGWDRTLTDGVIVLGRDGTWQPDARLPGITPQRGASFVLADNRWAVLLGGQADGRLLNRHYRLDEVPGTIFVP
jgi:DNA-binding CsgD family transcriptional regulator